MKSIINSANIIFPVVSTQFENTIDKNSILNHTLCYILKYNKKELNIYLW